MNLKGVSEERVINQGLCTANKVSQEQASSAGCSLPFPLLPQDGGRGLCILSLGPWPRAGLLLNP